MYHLSQVDDCLDGSDEDVTLWYQCNDKSRCYTALSHCDGISDCRDGTDELQCTEHAGLSVRSSLTICDLVCYYVYLPVNNKPFDSVVCIVFQNDFILNVCYVNIFKFMNLNYRLL